MKNDQDSFFYRQRGHSTASNIEEWRFPEWIKPGMLVELTGSDGVGKKQRIGIGEKEACTPPSTMNTTIIVLVTKITDNRGCLEGIWGEDLFRFYGKMQVSQIQDSSSPLSGNPPRLILELPIRTS